ncbi:MAG: ribosome recycling factor [Candidatus Eremiobacteraeota bacterium]|nr:ribosome recycling factor [Candidatus Eremiobacteraeota bacterium]
MLDDVYRETESKMGKAIEATRSDFASIRTGRASPSLLDRIMVEAYGSSQPLKGVASVNSPDGRSLLVTAFDKSVVGAIRKAIETSDLGLNPNVDGATIRLSIPQLNEERRKDLVKLVKKKSEEHKVAIRNLRHKAIDEMKALKAKDHAITDDQIKRGQDNVQKITDKFVKQIDELVVGKEKEIMEV